MPRLIIADDHRKFKDAFKELFMDSGLDIIGEAGDGLETLELVERLEPDLLLLDMRLPKLDGISVLKQLRKSHPELKIIMLTLFNNISEQAIRAGANGFCSKVCGGNKLLEGIERVLRGETVVINE